jgi:hypothetical protein
MAGMDTLNLRVRYRPLRIGLCIGRHDIDAFRNAVRVATTMWGGQFNIIVPVDEVPSEAQALTNAFRVDALFSITESDAVKSFIAANAHLRWPDYDPHLFLRRQNGVVSSLLDVYHPIRHMVEHPPPADAIHLKPVDVAWGEDDPLKDLFLATFGCYPPTEEIDKDYRSLFGRLSPEKVAFSLGEAVSAAPYEMLSPLALTSIDLSPTRLAIGHREPGFYVGSSQDITDLINFWNLRAANIELVFYDPVFHERLGNPLEAHKAWLQSRPKRNPDWPFHSSVWTKTHEPLTDLRPFGEGFAISVVDADLWDENVIWKPAPVAFEEQSLLATVSMQYERSTVTFQLPEKPCFSHFSIHEQKVVVSLRPLMQDSTFILSPPYTPKLNDFYGREIYHDAPKVRSELDGIGVIINVDRSDLTLRALDSTRLLEQIFLSYGVTASPSNAGKVGSRLIQQMGGLQGCRVFKIPGVRELIRAHGPLQSFTRSGAVQTIRGSDPASQKETFAAHKQLHLYYRSSGDWKPEDAFSYLLEKRMFRAGLSFMCPNCGLEFWLHLDSVKTTSACEYCDTEFNVMPQLRDRDWRFRRSGLFGRDDDQAGGIPVATVLQQLEVTLGGRLFGWTTGMELEYPGQLGWKCETDFVLLTESGHEGPQIAISEVKSAGGEITEADVRNLSRVADLFEKTTLAPYIVFAKLGAFTDAEVERCKVAKGRYRSRVILLSARELEPYFVYERTAKDFMIDSTAVSLQDLAQATESIFFSPRPREQQSGDAVS